MKVSRKEYQNLTYTHRKTQSHPMSEHNQIRITEGFALSETLGGSSPKVAPRLSLVYPLNFFITKFTQIQII